MKRQNERLGRKMIKISDVEIVGLRPAIRGMRNPKSSWDKSDSGDGCKIDGEVKMCDNCRFCEPYVYEDILAPEEFIVGDNDLALMESLAHAGTDHRKFMRMIAVYADITAPLYWWKEFDTYKVGTVRNSCSTMHTITNKEFTLDDFSHEHLIAYDDSTKVFIGKIGYQSLDVLNFIIIEILNYFRDLYLDTKDKRYWWQIIQLLPSSYNQKSTVMLNYEVLANIYRARKNHKLDEWREFCKWIETLPYAKELICVDAQKNLRGDTEE